MDIIFVMRIQINFNYISISPVDSIAFRLLDRVRLRITVSRACLSRRVHNLLKVFWLFANIDDSVNMKNGARTIILQVY